MTVIYLDRRARVPHECAHECGDPINPGDRYVMASLTPNDIEIGNAGWWHHALHGRSFLDCPRYKRNAPPAEETPLW